MKKKENSRRGKMRSLAKGASMRLPIDCIDSVRTEVGRLNRLGLKLHSNELTDENGENYILVWREK